MRERKINVEYGINLFSCRDNPYDIHWNSTQIISTKLHPHNTVNLQQSTKLPLNFTAFVEYEYPHFL